jgi:hypothetical protein
VVALNEGLVARERIFVFARPGEPPEPIDGDGPRVRCEGHPIARPPTVAWPLAHASLNRVLRYVTEDLPELLVTPLADRVVAALEQVTEEVVPVIEVPAVLAMQPLHPRRQVWLWRLDQQVHVVAHEAIREYRPAEPLDHLTEEP